MNATNPLLQKGYKYVLASKSPRRQYLLKELGVDFEIRTKDVDESFPVNLCAEEIPLYLSKKKADAFRDELGNDEVIITSDTIVWINGKALNKPESFEEAKYMLQTLSGKMHEVFTGVTIQSKHKQKSFYACTKVFFKTLTEQEITFYVETYKPYDKAGSYGAQEWIGLIGVERIDGSYFNVMGLPVKELYEELIRF
ncbi:MAG: septum formation protein Maf [Bacteroidetes bacterium]|nr:septum formation protein Maf [Bacteroidota bacterium]